MTRLLNYRCSNKEIKNIQLNIEIHNTAMIAYMLNNMQIMNMTYDERDFFLFINTEVCFTINKRQPL